MILIRMGKKYENVSSEIWTNLSDQLMSSTIGELNIEQHLFSNLGERRKDTVSVIFLIGVYCIIFISGLAGNLCTCIVIWKNSYMHSVTNYYLFNLAISDLLTLVLALPPEVYSIWEAYPWRLGEPFCILRSFIMEMTSYSSVLTITGFTIERYIAICHPIKVQRCCHVSRATRCIILIWTVSVFSALPYPIHTRTFYYLHDPSTGEPILDSLVCNIPLIWTERMITVFQMSTFIYFIVPMVVITLFYILIGVKLRESALSAPRSPQYGKATAARARRAILKMLVAVVVAFFLCWAPFHAQRLMTLYIKTWTKQLIEVQSYLFYVSGVLYFFSCTVNPILYNLLSRKFRRAFKRTLCRCCVNINSLPTFYMLKAKFINNDGHLQPDVQANSKEYVPERNQMRLVTFYRNEKQFTHSVRKGVITEKQLTKDTLLNRTSKEGSSSCSSHAHSDGGLHALCRHKRCTNRRQSFLSPRPNVNVASYQDIDVLKRQDFNNMRHSDPVSTEEENILYEDSVSASDHPILRITLRV
ncbi:pyrokinin-1 receptor-like [Ruditapes philippinarum]|uniref:pyrokinin-1 receptor-like n=1 Tax=Ruditapes philippinarum TaxID=129788 RepID=UPI00295A5F09|nr:pyrokinin-1 receptor-like [Ruditapes philippinarum]